jgi:hypothetical protein
LMIKHVVFFTARKVDDIDAVYDGLKILETIPCDGTVRIHRNLKIDQIENLVDVIVDCDFKDIKAMQDYKSHPTYQKSIDLVRPLRDMRIAADFEY